MQHDLSSIISLILPMTLMSGKDGNPYTSVFIIIITYILSLIMKYCNGNIFTYLIKSVFNKNTLYKVKCHISTKNNVFHSINISPQFKAVMYYLYEKITNDNNNRVKYDILEQPYWGDSTIKFVVFDDKLSDSWGSVLRRAVYDLTDNIQIMQDVKKEVSEKSDFKYITYTFSLIAKDKDMKSVIAFLNEITEKYEIQQFGMMNDNLRIFELEECDGKHSIYSDNKLQTTKSFDNMFFKDKQMLINRLDLFQNKHTERFQRLGIPQTFGMMFHGDPGTGKTSAIKAIARYTNRHIIMIPVKKLNTVEQLKRVFLDERINGIKIPMSKRLYVFEEIDCSSWKNIVTNRTFQKDIPKDTHKIDELAECLKTVIKSSSADEESATKKKITKTADMDLSLGELLNVIDGMVEMPGRMMIMTSNHPEMLDPAILRHGRIDLQINFKNLMRENIADMYKLWFDKNIPEEYYKRINDYTFSQAEIGNLFSTYDHTHILNTLVSK